MTRDPDYEEKSKLFAEQVEKERAEYSAKANEIISRALEKAARFQVGLIDLDISPEKVPALRLKADAAKHVLKLGGIEVERTKNETQTTVIITADEEKKILAAALL